MIDRLVAQRACLARGAALVAGLPGPVLELGLGKGRTYDHLRHLLPYREIFVFDRSLHAPAPYVPNLAHLILGDLTETLCEAAAVDGIDGGVALAHADIGTSDRAADGPLAARVGEGLAGLMRPGGVVLADRDLAVPDWRALELPPDTGAWPYFMWQVS
jgi:hypothetical protein